MLNTLWNAGVAVPAPVEMGASALLMEYIGEGSEAAPALEAVTVTAADAERLWRAILADVERMLRANVIHGDLSGYNVLVQGGNHRIIDLPQCVDPRFNASSFELLRRDLSNVHRPLGRAGVRVDTDAVAMEMWTRYVRGEL